MVITVADWIFNMLLWGAIVTFAALLYGVSQGLDANAFNPLGAILAAGVVAVLAAYWPKF